jgi:cell division transport system permease protein
VFIPFEKISPFFLALYLKNIKELVMKNEKPMTYLVFNLIKFAVLVMFCVIFVLIANHFCTIKDYAKSLSKNLNVIVFFDNNAKEEKSLKEDLENTGFVLLKEYVDKSKAYSKAIEANPFLKNVSVPNDAKSIEAYAVVIPKSIPDENFLLKMRNSLERVSNVSEVVFDASIFKQYVKFEKMLLSYHNIFFTFVVLIFVLFILKCVFFIAREELNSKKLIKKLLEYILASSLGFLATWATCVFTQYPLSIGDVSVLCAIPFSAFVGVVLDEIC